MTRSEGRGDGRSIQVTLSQIDDLSGLEAEWRAMEQSEGASFFQTWDWIGSLLETLPAAHLPHILRVLSDGRTVGLALLGRTSNRRRRIIRTRNLHLNETGFAHFDCITLEHNGILTRDGFERIALDAAIHYLASRPDWDEFYAGGMASDVHSRWSEAAIENGLWSVVRWEKPFHFVDLDRIRREGQGYLDSLSSNSRYQIRRARKTYAARGELRLRHASSLAEAQEWMQRLIDAHQAYWRAKGQPGAFAPRFANAFHTALIRRGWPRGAVEISEIAAGRDVLGHLYNLRKGRTLYSYQSGLVYDDDAKLKPGLVCHSLAAEDAMERGLGKYDLLAGESQYKRSLANATGVMIWSTLQQKRLLLGIENRLRDARSTWHARSTARPQGSVLQRES